MVDVEAINLLAFDRLFNDMQIWYTCETRCVMYLNAKAVKK